MLILSIICPRRYTVSAAVILDSDGADWFSAVTAGDVIFRLLLLRIGDQGYGVRVFDQLADVHECRVIRYSRRLLHVVGDDHDGVAVLDRVNQFFELEGGDR